MGIATSHHRIVFRTSGRFTDRYIFIDLQSVIWGFAETLHDCSGHHSTASCVIESTCRLIIFIHLQSFDWNLEGGLFEPPWGESIVHSHFRFLSAHHSQHELNMYYRVSLTQPHWLQMTFPPGRSTLIRWQLSPTKLLSRRVVKGCQWTGQSRPGSFQVYTVEERLSKAYLHRRKWTTLYLET